MYTTINELLRKAFRLSEDDRYDEAIATYQEVLKLEPTHEGAWIQLYFLVLEYKNDKEGALNILLNQYKLSPTNYTVLSQLALFYVQYEKNYEKADKYADLLLKNHSNEARTYNFMGILFIYRDREKALKLFKKSIEIDKTYLPPYKILAIQYEDMGRYEEAYKYAESGYHNGIPQTTSDSLYYMKYLMDEIKRKETKHNKERG